MFDYTTAYAFIHLLPLISCCVRFVFVGRVYAVIRLNKHERYFVPNSSSPFSGRHRCCCFCCCCRCQLAGMGITIKTDKTHANIFNFISFVYNHLNWNLFAVKFRALAEIETDEKKKKRRNKTKRQRKWNVNKRTSKQPKAKHYHCNWLFKRAVHIFFHFIWFEYWTLVDDSKWKSTACTKKATKFEWIKNDDKL